MPIIKQIKSFNEQTNLSANDFFIFQNKVTSVTQNTSFGTIADAISGELDIRINDEATNRYFSDLLLTPLTTTYSISANLQTQINSIITESTSISSPNHTITVGNIGVSYTLDVADYISKTSVASISGSLYNQISLEATNRQNADLLLTPLTTTAAVSAGLSNRIDLLTSATVSASGALNGRLVTVENNYATKASPISGSYNNVIVNSQGIVTSGGRITYVVPSGLTPYALTSTVVSVSGNLTTLINTETTNRNLADLLLTPLVTTAAISGSLQSQINNIVTESTSISSPNHTLTVGNIGVSYTLDVADYISKSTVAGISGGFNTRINDEVTNRTNADLLLTPLTTTSSISGALNTLIGNEITNRTNADLLLTPLTTTANISGGLNSRLTTVENNYATKASPISGSFNKVLVNSQGIVTSGGNIGYALSSDLNAYTLLSTTASISGNLNTLISNESTNRYFADLLLTPLTTTVAISGDLQSQIDSIVSNSTSISSSYNTINVNQVGLGYVIDVVDYVSKTTVAGISGSLNSLISNETANRISGDSLLTPLTTTASISGNLFTLIGNEVTNRSNADLLLTPLTTTASVSGNLFNLISNETANRISGDSLLTPLTLTASISGDLDFLIGNEVTNRTFADLLLTPLVTTASISGNLQDQIDAISIGSTSISSSGGSIVVTNNGGDYNIEVANAPIQNHNSLLGLQGGVSGTNEYYHLTYDQLMAVISGGGGGSSSGIQGRVVCTSASEYIISHSYIDPLVEFPVVSLEVANNASDLFVQGIYDRTATSFKVILSGTPDSSNAILYHISTQATLGAGLSVAPVSESPSGAINGINKDFTLSNTPSTGTLQLFLNGVFQTTTIDYSLNGPTITMVSAPLSGSALQGFYWLAIPPLGYDDIYTRLSTTASISGDLQGQIDNISQGSTSIASSGGSILVNQLGSSFNLEVASAPVSNHNAMLGLQGGISGQYHHLTSSEYSNITGARYISSCPNTTANSTFFPIFISAQTGVISAFTNSTFTFSPSANNLSVNGDIYASGKKFGAGKNSNVGNLTLGEDTLTSITSGIYNVAIGDESLQNTTIGNYNVAVGPGTLKWNFSGSNNTCLGASALRNNTTGDFNTAIGASALILNTTGYHNIALGNSSLSSNISGFYNTAIGDRALASCINGEYNIAIGDSALENNTTGVSNLAIGHSSQRKSTTGDYNITIGSSTLFENLTGSYNVAIGDSALSDNLVGQSNVAIGVLSLYKNTHGGGNLAIGASSLIYNISGDFNVGIGYHSLYNNTNGSYNLGIGVNSLYNNTNGYGTVAIGAGSVYSLNTGGRNTAIGTESLNSSQSGEQNTAIGYHALHSNVVGARNIAIGSTAGYYETGWAKLLIDSIERDSENDARNSAIIYGVMDPDPLEQTLALHAKVNIGNGLVIDAGDLTVAYDSLISSPGYIALRADTTGLFLRAIEGSVTIGDVYDVPVNIGGAGGLTSVKSGLTVTGDTTISSIAGISGSVVTHDAAGKLLNGNVLLSSLALTSTVASISGNLQNQFDSVNVIAGTNVQITESPINTYSVSVSGDLLRLVTLIAAPTPTTTRSKGSWGYYNGYLYRWVDDSVVVRSPVETSW